MNIETPRMIIRDFIPEDAADLHEIFGDDETMKNCEPAYDFDKTKEFLTSFCIGRKGAVAAVHKESNKVIGYILFNEADEGVYEMGWIYNRSFWRQGIYGYGEAPLFGYGTGSGNTQNTDGLSDGLRPL